MTSTISRLGTEGGQAAIEFVLVALVFLLTVFGMIQLTYLYRGKMQLDLACYRAARLAAVQMKKEIQDSQELFNLMKRQGKKSFSTWELQKRYQLGEVPEEFAQTERGKALRVSSRLPYPLLVPGLRLWLPNSNGEIELNTQCTLTSEGTDGTLSKTNADESSVEEGPD